MLTWLVRRADPLIGQAPGVAAELLTRAVASSPAGSAQHGWLASRLADALYRIGDTAAAEQVANRALEHAAEPDLLVDLHWTLAQCRMLAGESAESLATLDRALASPGISARHRARLLVLAARTHSYLGEVEKAGRVAATALAAASEAGDNWAMGWALHVLALVTAVQGHMTDALPLFDRALTVTESDPALTDLRLLLQINKAVTLGNLDRYEEALTAAGQARQLADQVGTAIRLAQAHGALGQLLFETGRWDDALAEVESLPENLKEPAAACCDLGIAAVISFHRGETGAARRHLAAAVPHAKRIGHRLIGPLAARPQPGPRAGRRPAGGAGRADRRVRRQYRRTRGDRGPAGRRRPPGRRDRRPEHRAGPSRATPRHSPPSRRSRTGRRTRCTAAACSTTTAPGCSRRRSAMRTAGRPLQRAKALEAAAGYFVDADDRVQARAAFTTAVEVYNALGAAADAARLQADVPGPRHPARAARQAPAGAERLGQPHGDRDQDRRVRGGGPVQPGDRGPAAAIPPDRRHARLPHPQEAQRQLADRHSQGIGPAHHPAEVTQPGSEVTRPGKQTSPGTPRPGRGVPGEFGGNCEAPG